MKNENWEDTTKVLFILLALSAGLGLSVHVLLHPTTTTILLAVIAWSLVGIYSRLNDIAHSLHHIDLRTEHHLPTANEQDFKTGPGAPLPGDDTALWRKL